MKIIIFGAGAIGSLFGAHLARNHEVTLICRKKHAQAINQNGLKIIGLSEIHVHPKAVFSLEGLEQPDILFLTVKAYDTEQAIQDAKPLIGPETKIVSLQNGLGNLEAIASTLPKVRQSEENLPGATIIGGVTSHGAILREPGIIEHTGHSYTLVDDEIIASLLTEVGIETQASDNIQAQIWYKAIVNAVINPIGTLMKNRNGLLIRDPRFQAIARQIVSEGIAVAEAKGIALCPEYAWQKVIQVATETSENICSMRFDIDKGKKTEINQMNGAIARYGSELGIPTPANSLITALILAL